MSFTQVIDNYIIKFEKEEDYLNCRLQYVQYCKGIEGLPEVTFEQYVITGMYPKGTCVVENIEPVVIPSSTSIGNDSNYFSFDSGNFTIGTSTMGNMGMPITNTLPGGTFYYNEDINTIGTMSNVGTISNVSLYPNALSSEQLAEVIWNPTISAAMSPTISTAMSHSPIPSEDKKVEEKKEEPLDDPIKNRWEILDIRKDIDEN